MPVRIVFLGGLGEIGRNCFCIEVEGRILVVDCGIMFPDADMPGIDLVLPDFTYLRENAERVEIKHLDEALDALVARFLSVPLDPAARSAAVAFRERLLGTTDLDRAKTYLEEPLRETAHLIMSTPEYQLA